MKRILLAIFASVYITTSTGAVVHMHYCMGDLASWGFGYDQATVCSECGMDESDMNDAGCCKDEHRFIKTDDDQKKAENLVYFVSYASNAIGACNADRVPNKASLGKKERFSDNSPPRWRSVAVYLFKRTFLI